MRIIILVSLASLFFTACNKDKYTTAPQIKYKSINSNVYANVTGAPSPAVTFTITDAEGDIGITDQDTARIYIKNLTTQLVDSMDFPDLKDVSKSNFKAEVSASVGRLGGCISSNPPNHIDTMYYEIYVKDFAKNQSNTIVTADPIFEQCP